MNAVLLRKFTVFVPWANSLNAFALRDQMTLFNNPVIGQLCKFSLRNHIDPGPIRQRV